MTDLQQKAHDWADLALRRFAYVTKRNQIAFETRVDRVLYAEVADVRATNARYADLASYVLSMGAPLSQLPGAQAFTFHEPIEGVILLVEGVAVEWCDRCNHGLAECGCPF